LLAKLNREYGKTIVMVTHDPHAASFATRACRLDKGLLLPEADTRVLPQKAENHLQRAERY
jgi:putative ABC transport system ATP-binding protein